MVGGVMNLPASGAFVQPMNDELDELRETVAQLEDRIETLEGRIDANAKTSGASGKFDRYDQYVLDHVDDVVKADPRHVMKVYGDAGVVNKKKQKKRTKRLRRIKRD